MSATSDSAEQRKLRSVARRYKRDGYRVSYPGRGESTPAFLQAFKPDLIAESEQDRVIVEIKRSDAVPGSNELQDIAERVSHEPGWRFELVAIEPTKQDRKSNDKLVKARESQLNSIESDAREAMNRALPHLAYTYVLAFVQSMVVAMASQQGLPISIRKTPFIKAAHELASRGIIDGDTFLGVERAYDRLPLYDDALSWNEQTWAERIGALTNSKVEELLALAHVLQRDFASIATD